MTNRQPKGIPVGGQFATGTRGENGDLTLGEQTMGLLDFDGAYRPDCNESYAHDDVLLTDSMFVSNRVWRFEEHEDGSQTLVPASKREPGAIYTTTEVPWETGKERGVFREAKVDPWDKVDWATLRQDLVDLGTDNYARARRLAKEPEPMLDASKEFPYGPMNDNLNMITGEYDFERPTSEGLLRPVLSCHPAQEDTAVDQFLAIAAWQADTGSMDAQTFVRNVESTVETALGGQRFNWMASSGTAMDLRLVASALRDKDEELAKQGMRGMIEVQRRSQRIVRPLGQWSPAGKDDAEAKLEAMRQRHGRFIPRRVIAEQVRADIREAQEHGYLPKGLRYSVTSGQDSVNVTVKGADPQWVIDEGAELRSRVERLRWGYGASYYGGVQFEGADGMGLYAGGKTWQ